MMSAESVLKQFAAGVVGGAVGTLAMDYYWKAATALSGQDPRSLTAEEAPDTLDEMSAIGQQHEEGEPSTVALGRKAHETITGDEPSSEEKKTLSHTVHWTYGSMMGGVYGVLRGPTGGADLSGGTAYGTALWAVGDELMVPLLGLAKGPTAFPMKQHVHRFGAHIAYGTATALTTQALMRTGSSSSLWEWGWRAAKMYAKWRTVKTVGQGAWNAIQRWQSSDRHTESTA